MYQWIKNLWLSVSLKKKLWLFAGTVSLILALSVVFNIELMDYSLKGFNGILDDNSRCNEFMEAMEQEVSAFEDYIRYRSAEYEGVYRAACERTRQSIMRLPYDYTAIGPVRYARTWSVKNGYEAYSGFREELLSMEPEGDAFIDRLYEVYKMQDYLVSYGSRLMRVTLREGNKSYQKNVPVFHWIPYAILGVSVLLLAAVLFLTRVLSSAMVTPLLRLAHCSRRIEANDFEGGDFSVENKDEMGELVLAFNKMKRAMEIHINTLREKNEMAERLHKEELERIKMEKRLEAARLELLRNQINPHFLFNTLSMIACTAKLEGAETSEKMISSLSKLFRYNLKTSEPVVSLEKELEVVRDYIYIQQMRFGERIQYHLDLELNPGEVKVPAFTMQPLVENSIIHGLSKKEEGGKILIKVRREEKNVVISVADTGIGMNEEQLRELKAALTGSRTAKVGIGLGNICKRIAGMYENGDFRISSKEGKGTVVQLIVPQDEIFS